MRIIKTKNYDEMSRYAANIIAAEIIQKPNCVLGLATGETPEGIYKRLVQLFKQGDIDFSSVSTVNLDEYKGLERTDSHSYYSYMHNRLFKHVNLNEKSINIPDGTQRDVKKACEEYDKCIQDLGGVDLQLLGLGHNGHIGFNEPSDRFIAKTHCVNLSSSTREANSRFFSSVHDVPMQAYTMGILNIMKAKKIVVVVNGENKADAVRESFFGSITPKVQASILQVHPDVTVVADEAALSKCKF